MRNSESILEKANQNSGRERESGERERESLVESWKV